MTPLRLTEILARSDLLWDRAAIEDALQRMAGQLDELLSPDSVPLLLTILQGGLHTAAGLSLNLRRPVEFDLLQVGRYRRETRGGELSWLHRPATPLLGREVVLVDDIVDEGHTLDAVLQWARQQGAAKVWLASLVWKRHDRGLPDLQPDVWGLEVPDRYVFGFGMDYQGHLRNLPEIRALSEEDQSCAH